MQLRSLFETLFALYGLNSSNRAFEHMPQKKKPRRRQDETVFYVVEIEGWEWSYSFGVNRSRHVEDPYLEFRHLEIHGKLLRPQIVKAETVELVLMPDQRLNEANRQRNKPRGVGSLNLYKGELRALVSIPVDVLDPILQTLIAERLKFAVMDGTRLRYRQGLITHLRLDEALDEDDLPPGEE